MKNIAVAVLMCLTFLAFSQENNTWRLGLQWGFQGNSSQFSGGMKDANARFQHNSFGGSALSFNGRYDFDKHWMLMLGLGINTFGFDFALSENYSLLSETNRFSSLKTEFGALEIPLMGYYKFNPNCKNKKWIVGLGFANTFVGAQTISRNYSQAADGNSTVNYLKSDASAAGGIYTMLRFAVGRERVFKRGNILNVSLLFNAGLRNMATAKVAYTLDGKEYTHEFTNSGNFVGFRLTYFFRALNTSPSQK